MQKTILFIILIINSQLGKSQNIEEYYKSINHAELAIVDSNYQQAVIDYELAFKNNPQPLGKDIYNFAICNLFENNFAKSIELFQQLVDLEYYIKNFKEIKATELGKTLPASFFQKLEEHKPTGRIKLNYALRDSLNKIHESDQYFREKKDGYKIYADTIKKIDEENDKKLRRIIAKHGYPNEYLIGVNQNLNPSLKFNIVIWNQYFDNRISNWVDPIKDAIWNGKLEPHLGASLIENHVGYDGYLATPFLEFECKNCSPEAQNKINGKIFYTSYIKNMEQKNQFREGVYMETYEDFLIKSKYDLKQNKYFKLFHFIHKVFGYDNEEDLENSLKHFLEEFSVWD